eukprot:2746540-Rhodomonas_salina.1
MEVVACRQSATRIELADTCNNGRSRGECGALGSTAGCTLPRALSGNDRSRSCPMHRQNAVFSLMHCDARQSCFR